jgi:hypothetical protein
MTPFTLVALILIPLLALFVLSLCMSASPLTVAERMPVARVSRKKIRQWRRERLVLPGNRWRT